MKRIILASVILISFLFPAWATNEHVMSTDELLSLAQKNSEAITEAQFNEIVAQKDIDIARANYFPILNAEAIDSKGFPGSSQLANVDGLVGSPFRSGGAGGLVAQQLVLDFGRTAADIRAAKAGVDVARQTTRVTAYEVKTLALQVFYQCARFKKQHDIWAHLAHESNIITREANHFVRTGQRSIVDKYLSDSQTEEARTAYVFFGERLKGAINELSVITGLPADSFTCPSLSDDLIDSLNPKDDIYASPYVARAQADAKVAQEKLQREKADLWPKVLAVGSAGGMAQTHLVQKENYAVGIGVVMPIFDLNITSRVNRAQAVLMAKQQDIQTQKQFLEEMNAKYDEIIQSTIVRIQHLNVELKIAREGFDVAKKRYFTEEGDLVDLREAWRNLARSETTIEDARTDLLQASGAKALLNGDAG